MNPKTVSRVYDCGDMEVKVLWTRRNDELVLSKVSAESRNHGFVATLSPSELEAIHSLVETLSLVTK